MSGTHHPAYYNFELLNSKQEQLSGAPMVRLRTDRWYGLDGQRRLRRQSAKQVSSSRHLVSLVLLLVLILLLMDKVSEPERVQQVFSALGVPFEQQVTEPLQEVLQPTLPATSNRKPTTSSTAPASPDAFTITCRSLLDKLLDDLPQDSRDKLAKIWFGKPIASSGFATSDLAWLERLDLSVREELQEIRTQLSTSETQDAGLPDAQSTIDPKEPSIAQWRSLAEKFELQWAQLGQQIRSHRIPGSLSQTERLDATFRSELSQCLDRLLIRAMKNASPWSSNEFVAFSRMLQRSSELSGRAELASTPLLSTHQLKAGETIRGDLVRFRGTVRRVESIVQGSAAFGYPDGYWRLWMRGEDNSSQPVAVYTLDVQAGQLRDALDKDPDTFPNVEVRAIISKSLAYAAQSGIEVAPTLFAADLQVISTGVTAEGARAAPQSMKIELWIVGVSCLIAAIIVAPLVRWKSRSRSSLRKRISPIGQRTVSFLVAWVCLTHNVSLGTEGKSFQPPWSAANNITAAMKILDRDLTEAVTQTATLQLRDVLRHRATEFLPDTVPRLAFLARRVGWQNIEEASLGTKLAGGRITTEHWQGIVRHAATEPLSPSQLKWYAVDSRTTLYRIELEQLASKKMVTLFCESVPKVWLSSAQLRQPCEIRGLAVLPTDGESAAPLCGFARQPIWTFDDRSSVHDWQPAIHSDHFLLGQAGWNLAWIETLAGRQQKPLDFDEHEAFHSILDATARLPSHSSFGPPSLLPLATLREPNSCIGRFVKWPVRIVRGSFVAAGPDSADMQMSTQSYYQLDGLIDIPGQRIEYKLDRAQSTNSPSSIEFSGEFPITLVCRSIPDEFNDPSALGAGRTQWTVGRYAIVEGVFYRLWGYHSSQIDELNPQSRQVAPLVIATRLVPATPPARHVESGSVWVSWALCLAMLSCLGIVWRYAFTRELDQRRRRIRKTQEGPARKRV